MTNLTDLLPAGAGGKQVSFTADGSISQGNAVALTSAGKAKAISSTGNPATVPNGSVTDVTTSMNGGGVNQKIEFDPHNSNRVIATSIDGNGYQRLTVGTYSGNTVTWGTPVVLLSDYIGQSSPFTFDPVNENEIVIVLKETGNDYRLVPATISGTSITLGVKNQFHSTSAIKVTGGMIAMDPSSSTRQGVIGFVSSDDLEIEIRLDFEPGQIMETGDAVYETFEKVYDTYIIGNTTKEGYNGMSDVINHEASGGRYFDRSFAGHLPGSSSYQWTVMGCKSCTPVTDSEIRFFDACTNGFRSHKYFGKPSARRRRADSESDFAKQQVIRYTAAPAPPPDDDDDTRLILAIAIPCPLYTSHAADQPSCLNLSPRPPH